MNNLLIKTYKELVVWQKAMELVVSVYELTEKYPKTELYGLMAQTRRSAVSIPSNIAEGRRRSTRRDYAHFLTIAFGSGSELETQIEIAKRLSFGANFSYSKIDILLDEIMRMLNAMISKLQATS